MANDRMIELAKRLRALKDRKTTLETELTEIEKELKTITQDTLPTMMDENDITKFTVDGVGTIYTQTEIYAYVLKENEAAFHSWLKENDHGDLVREYVFPATLKAWAKEQLEQMVELPEIVKATKVPTARLKRK